MAALIELRNIEKTFLNPKGADLKIFDHLDLTVPQGVSIAIVGPSGAGKTSLIKLLSFLNVNYHGDYIFEGKVIRKLKEAERANLRNEFVGYVDQEYRLVDDFNVSDNISLANHYAKHPKSKKFVENRVSELLEKLDIADLKHLKVIHASGGQRQRIAIARALFKKPKLLIADEPTASLDDTNANAVSRMIITDRLPGQTVISVTHDPNYAKKHDFIYELSQGKLTLTKQQNE